MILHFTLVLCLTVPVLISFMSDCTLYWLLSSNKSIKNPRLLQWCCYTSTYNQYRELGYNIIDVFRDKQFINDSALLAFPSTVIWHDLVSNQRKCLVWFYKECSDCKGNETIIGNCFPVPACPLVDHMGKYRMDLHIRGSMPSPYLPTLSFL